MAPSFRQTSIPLTQECFRPSLVEIEPDEWFWHEKQMKMLKNCRWKDRQIDKQQEIRKDLRRFALTLTNNLAQEQSTHSSGGNNSGITGLKSTCQLNKEYCTRETGVIIQ